MIDEDKPVPAKCHVVRIRVLQPQVHDQHAARLGLSHRGLGQLHHVICSAVCLHGVRLAEFLCLANPQHRQQSKAHANGCHGDRRHRNLAAPAHRARTARFRIPITAMPTAKADSTNIFPCLTNSPSAACAARKRNPPPACASTAPSQKVEISRRKKIPSTPPNNVVASTAATHTTVFTGANPAPSNSAPSPRPSGTLCTHTASSNDKSTRAPIPWPCA